MEIIMIHNHETWTSTCECEFMASGPVTRMSNHCIRYGWLFFFLVQQHPCLQDPLQRRTTKVLVASSMLTTCLNLLLNVLPTACSTSTTALYKSHLVNHCLFAFCTVAQHSDSLYICSCTIHTWWFHFHHSSKLDVLFGLHCYVHCFAPIYSLFTFISSNEKTFTQSWRCFGSFRPLRTLTKFTRVLYVLFTVVLSFQAFNVRKSFIFGGKMACTA